MLNLIILSNKYSLSADRLHLKFAEYITRNTYYYNVNNHRRNLQNTRAFQRILSTPQFTVLNWGSKILPEILSSAEIIINHPHHISIMSDKIKTFKILQEINPLKIPTWTTDINIAKQWLPTKVFCRQLTHSSQGRNIILANSVNEIVPAPLYTKYTKGKYEYRIHFTELGIFSIKRKARRQGSIPLEEENKYIKSRNNGWILIDITPSIRTQITEELNSTLIQFCKKSNLSFGAADVSYNESQNKYYILEINSAPGIQNSTIYSYLDNLTNLITHKQNLLHPIPQTTQPPNTTAAIPDQIINVIQDYISQPTTPSTYTQQYTVQMNNIVTNTVEEDEEPEEEYNDQNEF